MKKLIKTGAKQCKLIDVDMPVITEDDQVLIKLKYCGVCRSEHDDWASDSEGQSFGHEPIGVVVEAGKNAKLKVGDYVSGLFGGNCEYAVSKEPYCLKIPENVTPEQAVLEPLSCLISAVNKTRIPLIGDKVAVVGCGYMGCGAISLLKKRGAYVVGVDLKKECLENAKRYGADEVYTPDELPAQYVTVDFDHNAHGDKPVGKRGFDLVMEWAETNESLDLAINMTATCGQLAVGAYHTGEKRLVNMQQLGVKAIDLLNTHPRENDINLKACANAIKMLVDDSWSFKNVPTKVWPITMFDKAQEEIVDKHGYMKSLVDWTKTDGEPYIID